jgi:hypothetical protein
MERNVFEGNYLIVFYYTFDYEYDCYCCHTKQEVFQVLTEKITDAISFIQEDCPEDYESLLNNEDGFAQLSDMLAQKQIITNPAIIQYFFGIFYDLGTVCAPFRVFNDRDLWFSYRCGEQK